MYRFLQAVINTLAKPRLFLSASVFAGSYQHPEELSPFDLGRWGSSIVPNLDGIGTRAVVVLRGSWLVIVDATGSVEGVVDGVIVRRDRSDSVVFGFLTGGVADIRADPLAGGVVHDDPPRGRTLGGSPVADAGFNFVHQLLRSVYAPSVQYITVHTSRLQKHKKPGSSAEAPPPGNFSISDQDPKDHQRHQDERNSDRPGWRSLVRVAALAAADTTTV